MLAGRIPSKKNSKQLIKRGNRRFFVPSDTYNEWHENQMMLFTPILNKIKYKYDLPIKKCSIIIKITFPDNIKSDLTNKAESLMDLLVDLGVLEDDNHFNCKQLTLISVGVDKAKCGAYIDILY